MTAPTSKATPVFHITHCDNLPSIAANGLHCDRTVAGVATARGIAYAGIKAQRALTTVPIGPGGTVADYVPFYFAPRSPMLYTISQNNVPGAEDTHDDIVHLVLSASSLAKLASGFVFTSGHAIMALSEFYGDLDDLTKLDWEAINTRRWGSYYDATDETKRKKQSEFLVRDHVPWSEVVGIGVKDKVRADKVSASLAGVTHQPKIVVRSDWYYS